MTYKELYTHGLEEQIRDGGKQAAVDKAISEYNVFNQEAFNTWLTTLTKVACISCSESFAPESPTANLNIVCSKCCP